MSKFEYPLHWPPSRFRRQGVKETAESPARFKSARDKLLNRLGNIGATFIIISNNGNSLTGNLGAGTDAAVAAYFTRSSQTYCITCDRFDTVADNIRVIAKTVERLRDLEELGAVSVSHLLGGLKCPNPDPSWASKRPEPKQEPEPKPTPEPEKTVPGPKIIPEDHRDLEGIEWSQFYAREDRSESVAFWRARLRWEKENGRKWYADEIGSEQGEKKPEPKPKPKSSYGWAWDVPDADSWDDIFRRFRREDERANDAYAKQREEFFRRKAEEHRNQQSGYYYTGRAKPPGSSTTHNHHWTFILGVPSQSTPEQVETAFRKLARDNHPDRGGTKERFQEINNAYESYKREKGIK